MNRKNFALSKKNFIMLAIGMAIVIIGFILMSGGGSTETHYDPTIFSARRIKVAPMVCLFGFLFMIFAILFHSKKDDEMEAADEKQIEATETKKAVETNAPKGKKK